MSTTDEKTIAFEKALREMIATQIDNLCTDECQTYPNIYYHNAHNAAADIARGVKQ